MSDLRNTRRDLLAAASAGALAGLVPNGLIPATEALAQAGPRKGGVHNVIAFPEPPTLFIGLDQNGSTQTVAGKIYESLLTYDFDFTPRPSLAKSWEISPDGLVYTFHLQENVKWHDGKPFSADDVVFSISDFLMEMHPRARPIFQNCSKIEALDPQTVRFTLKQVFAPFMLGFEFSTTPIIPAHLYKGTNFRSNPNNANPVGTGPFKLGEWRKGAFIKLVRNPEYYIKDQPYLDEIYFHILPDANARALAMEQGRVQQSQFFDLEGYDVQRLAEASHLQLITKGYEFFAPVVRLEFNTRVKPFDDKRFRQAINYALDRQLIVDNIFFGQGKVATGPFNSRTRFYDGNVKKYDYNLATAKALLDDMGLKPDSRGVRSKVTFLRLPWGEAFARLAEYVKQSLAQIGIEVEIESADPAGWTSRYANWEFQITSNNPYQFGDPALGIARFFVSSNIRKGVAYSNCTGYSSPVMDDLFARGAATIDPAERQKIYSEAQRILVEDVPMAWLFEYELPTLVDRRLKDCVVSAIGVNETYRQAFRTA